jgi:NADH-quinone oxidoreductase subunit M
MRGVGRRGPLSPALSPLRGARGIGRGALSLLRGARGAEQGRPRFPGGRGVLAALVVVVVVVVLGGAGGARGEGGGGRLEVAPSSLSFDEAGETRTLVLRNAGGAALHVGAISFVVAGGRGASEFRLDALGPHELAPGESLAVPVTYHPVGSASRASFAALLIPADDPRLPADLGGRLSGPVTRRIATVALRAGETHLLTAIFLLPLLGALLLGIPALGSGRRPRVARAIAALAAGGPLVLAALALARFDPTSTVTEGGFGVQLVAHHVLVRALDIEYFVGVDGLSIAFVALAALLGFVATVSMRSGAAVAPSSDASSGARAGAPPRAAALLLQAGASGVFVALDGFLFWLFWLLAIVGVAALARASVTSAPGSGRREPSLNVATILVAIFAGAAILLLALGALHAHSTATYLCDGTPASHTFDLVKLANANGGAFAAAPARLFGLPFGAVTFWALFAAFAMTAPLFPLGAWAPALASRAPAGVAGLLSGILPAMAIYGLARLALPLVPEAALSASPAIAALGTFGVLYATLLARAATDVRRFLACAGSARVAFCLVGLSRATPAGLSGALAQVLASAVVSTLCFGLADAALAPGATLADLEGLAGRAPRAAKLLAFAALASMGAPGLATFFGPALIVLDAFGRHAALASLLLVAFAFCTGAHARVVRRAFSPAGADMNADAGAGPGDLDRRALALALPLAALVLAFGLAPAALLDVFAVSVRDLVRLLASTRG